MAKRGIEKRYGLRSDELLDAVVARRPLRRAFERAVAEDQMTKVVDALVGPIISSYAAYSSHGLPSFVIWLHGRDEPIWARCKNAYVRRTATDGVPSVMGHYVAAHDPGISLDAPERSLYSIEHFQLLGVCLGKITSKWSDFLFARTIDLDRHDKYSQKLAIYHRLPLQSAAPDKPWYSSLAEVLNHYDDPPL